MICLTHQVSLPYYSTRTLNIRRTHRPYTFDYIHNIRGGLGELGHFLYFNIVCFSHLSYYTVSCGFAKYRACQTIWTFFYFTSIALHRKMRFKKDVPLTQLSQGVGRLGPCSGRLGPCLGELGHIENVCTDTSKYTQHKKKIGTIYLWTP